MTTAHLGVDREMERHEKLQELRKLAAWYREFAERAGNPAIWESRLRTAQEFEREADRLERGVAAQYSRQREQGQLFTDPQDAAFHHAV